MAAQIIREARRVYAIDTPYSAKDALKSLGCKWDADRRAWWIGVAKADQLAALVASLNAPVDPSAPKPKENPDNIRLTGKGRYKGREYYAGAITRDGTKVRLLTLPDADGKYLDFWADCAQVEQTKTYSPREYRGQTEYTTLGSIAKFIARQRRAEADGLPACAACGKRGQLHHDIEDGLMKCYRCCDMPE